MVTTAPVMPAMGPLRLVVATGLPFFLMARVFHPWIAMAMPAAGHALARSPILARPSESPLLSEIVHVHCCTPCLLPVLLSIYADISIIYQECVFVKVV
jgi:hypothetical protein